MKSFSKLRQYLNNHQLKFWVAFIVNLAVINWSSASTLHVIGVGSHTQMADIAKVEFNLTSRALLEKSLLGLEKPPEIENVFSNLKAMEKTTLDAVKKIGDVQDLVAGGFRFNPIYTWNKTEEKRLLQGYEGHLRIAFTLENRSRLNALYDTVAKLTESGVVQRFAVTDALDDEAGCLKKAREKAISDAWTKAKHMAQLFKLKSLDIQLEEARITNSTIEPRRDPIVYATMARSMEATQGPELTPAQKECMVTLEASFVN